MPELKQEKFVNVFKNKFEDVEAKIIALDNFAIEQKFSCEGLNFWQSVRYIREEINLKNDRIDWKAEQAVIGMLSIDKLELALNNKQFIVSDDLTEMTVLVAAFLGQTETSEIYELDKIKSFLKGDEAGIKRNVLLFTLRQDLNHKDGRDTAFEFIKNILMDLDDKDCDWFRALVYIVLFHIAFRYFDSFSDDIQIRLLKKGLFKSQLAHAPANDYLSKFLYDTDNVGDLLIRNQMLYDAISNSEEKIYTQGKIFDLKILISDFIGKNEDILNKNLIVQYVGALQIDNSLQNVKEAMVESIYLSCLIHEVKLINHNSSQDLSESEIAFRQMEKLLLLFANRVHWPEMIGYFEEKEGNYVSWISFLRGFRDTDLKDEAVVEKFTAFGEFLKKNGFLDKDKDLVEFHEADNQFHWNEKIFS